MEVAPAENTLAEKTAMHQIYLALQDYHSNPPGARGCYPHLRYAKTLPSPLLALTLPLMNNMEFAGA